jgi:3-deoxy-manno-octulosonate cytidylyltransferase (CMP-KDO synthetase)
MLHFIEHGHGVRMLGVMDEGLAVDTPEDLAKTGTLLRTHTKRANSDFS